MNTPSGYTALDLIGFTDRGAYDSTANYVKNDLTHDLSNKIWRCLIDDTHGVAPAEGVNWTLFIDSQTALSGMSDVQITTPATGEALVYDGTASKWKNELLADVALSGDYDDIINLPTLGTAAAKDSTNAVTQGSTDLVESGAVYSGLADKVNTSDVGTAAEKDSTSSITQGSTDLIEAGAVYSALSGKADTSSLGTAAAKDSTNAVTQNSTDLVESGAVYTSEGVIKTAFVNNVENNGSKNVLWWDLNTLKESNTSGTWSGNTWVFVGLTYTFNDDKTVTVTGTGTGSPVNFNLWKSNVSGSGMVHGKTYVISGGGTSYEDKAEFYIDGVQVADLDTSTASYEFTYDSSKSYAIVIASRVVGKSHNVTYKPMICLKSDYDLDPTYVPPVKTNRQLTQETTGLLDNTMVNGAVNMFVPPYDAGNSTYSNIPITNNSDGSFTIGSGTISSTSVWCEFISKRKFVNRCRGKRIKLVIISNYTTNADFNVQGGVYDANDQQVASFEDGTNYINPVNGKTEKTIYVPSTAEYVSFRIWARSTTTISQSFTIYPMLVVEGYDGEYVKGVMSNEELVTPEYFDLSVRSSRVSIVAQKNCRIGKQVFIWCKFTPIVSGADLPALTIPAKYCPPSVGNDMGVALNIVPKYNSPDRSNFMWALAFATGEIDVMSVSNGNDYLVSGSYYIA